MKISEEQIVVVKSPRSKFLGKFGFVYKVFPSGRYGVMLDGGVKVCYTEKGIALVETEDAADPSCIKHRDKCFSDKNGTNTNGYSNDKADSKDAINNTKELQAAIVRLSEVVVELKKDVAAMAQKTDHGFSVMDRVTAAIHARLDALESAATPGDMSMVSDCGVTEE